METSGQDEERPAGPGGDSPAQPERSAAPSNPAPPWVSSPPPGWGAPTQPAEGAGAPPPGSVPPVWGAPPPPPGWGAPPTPAWGAPAPPNWGMPVPPPPAWGPSGAAGAIPAPGARTKRRGWAWLWILITSLVVLTGLGITGIVLLATTLSRPTNVTNAYLRAVRDGRYTAAYNNLCDARKRETSLTAFTDSQRQRLSTEGAVLSFDVYNSDLHGHGRASADYDLVRTLVRQSWHVDMVKEHGTYRLCHFSLLSG